MNNDSRIRVSSLSANKHKKAQITKLYYPPPNDKQFIAYSLIQKQSGLGFISHQRLLLLDSLTKSLRYYSKIPQPLPHPQLPLPDAKQIIFMKKCKNFSFKNTKSGIAKVLVKYMNLNGQSKTPSQWNLSFINKKIMEEWVIMVGQVYNQQHKNPQNRPISVSRQAPKVNQSKYMTTFIGQTGGYSSRIQSSQQKNDFLNSRLKNNNNSLASYISQKQKQVEHNHRLIHSIGQNQIQQQKKLSYSENVLNQMRETQLQKQKQKQKYQTQPRQPSKTQLQQQNLSYLQQIQPQNKQSQTFSIPSKNPSKLSTSPQTTTNVQVQNIQSNSTFKKLPPSTRQNLSHPTFAIPQVDNQSKASNISDTQKQKKGNNKFYINRMPPSPILQIDTISVDQSQTKNNQKYKNRFTLNNQNIQQIKQQKPITNKQFTQSLNQYNSFKRKLQKTQIDNVNQNIMQLLSAQKFSKSKATQTNPQPKYQWISSHKYYPFLYHQFMNKCLQIIPVIVQNLSSLIKSSILTPTINLYISHNQSTPSSQLHIIQHNIHFILTLPKSSLNSSSYSQKISSQYFNTLTKIKQYSSMAGYIHRLSTNNVLNFRNKINAVLPIPYCVVQYGLFWVKCKVDMNPNVGFQNIGQKQGKNLIDQFFKIPKGVWQYYTYQDTLIVDYTLDKIPVNSQQNDKQLLQIFQSLYRQQIMINHCKDLFQHCLNRFNYLISTQQILKIYKKFVRINPNSPISSIILSILFAIFTYNNIIQSLPQLNSIPQLLSYLISILPSICFNKNSQLYNKIIKQFIIQIQEYSIQIKGQQIDKIDMYCVFSSLLDLFSIQNQNKTNQNLSLHISNLNKAKFKQRIYGLWIENLCVEMDKVKEILRLSQIQNWNQQKIYERYEKMKEQLSQFQQKWNQSDAKKRSFTVSNYSSVGSQGKRRNSLFSPKTQLRSRQTIIQSNSSLPIYSNLHTRILYHHSLYTPYHPSYISTPTSTTPSKQHSPSSISYSQQLQSTLLQSPPSCYSYLIGINCIKWVSKLGLTGCQIVNQIIQQQIQRCKRWVGQNGLALLNYYQVAAVYYQQIFNITKSIFYARLALELVNNVYGNLSIQAAQRWFMLANIIIQDQDLYTHAIQSYQNSLQILQQNPISTKPFNQNQNQSSLLSSSKSNLLINLNTPYTLSSSTSIQAQLKILLKILKLRLVMNNIQQCINQCAKCLQLCQILDQVDLDIQLEIYGALIRCLEITRQQHKLISIVQTLIQRFTKYFSNNNHITQQQQQYYYQSTSNKTNYNNNYNNNYKQKQLKSQQNKQIQQHYRQQILKLCLSPYIKYYLNDPIQQHQLYILTIQIRQKYQNRHTKKQYHEYITKQIGIINKNIRNKYRQKLRQRQRQRDYQRNYRSTNTTTKSKQRQQQYQIQKQRQQQISVLQWIINIMKQFYTIGYMTKPKNNRTRTVSYNSNTYNSINNNSINNNNNNNNQLQDIQYTLYDNQMINRIQPITQNKQLIPTMRAIQSICGIIGFAYMQACLSD